MKSKWFMFMIIGIILIVFIGGCGPKESLDSSILSTTEEATEEQTEAIPDIQTTEDVPDTQTTEDVADIQTTEDVPDIQTTEDIQAAGKEENDLAHKEYIKHIKEGTINNDGYKADIKEYAFFDIDGNGIDELITSGFYSYIIYTYSDGEIIELLHCSHGGGRIKIYSDSKCVFTTGGIHDCYYESYNKINGNKSETVAEKNWYVTYLNDTGSEYSTRYEYSVMGKPVEKSEYKKYVKSIKQSSVITHKELEWNKVLRSKTMEEDMED